MNIKLQYLTVALGCAFLGHAMLAQEVTPKAEQQAPSQPDARVEANAAPFENDKPTEPSTASPAEVAASANASDKEIPNITGWWEVVGSEDAATKVRSYRQVVRSDETPGFYLLYSMRTTEPQFPAIKGNSSKLNLMRGPMLGVYWDSAQKRFSGAWIIRSDWPVPYRSELPFELIPTSSAGPITTELKVDDEIASKKIRAVKEIVALHRELDKADQHIFAIVHDLKPKEEWKRVSPPTSMQIGNSLVAETETGLKVINTKTGTPAEISVGAPSNGETRLERMVAVGNFLAGLFDNKVLAYSASASTWGVWEIAPQERNRLRVSSSGELLALNADNKPIAYFTAEGKWLAREALSEKSGQVSAEQLSSVLRTVSPELPASSKDLAQVTTKSSDSTTKEPPETKPTVAAVASDAQNLVGYWFAVRPEHAEGRTPDPLRIWLAGDGTTDLFVNSVPSYALPAYKKALLSPYRFKWNPEQKRFELADEWSPGVEGMAARRLEMHLSPSQDAGRLSAELKMDDAAKKTLEELKGPRFADIENTQNQRIRFLLSIQENATWKRRPVPNHIKIGDKILFEMNEGFKIVDPRTGSEVEVPFERPANGLTRLEFIDFTDKFLYGIVNNQLVAYAFERAKLDRKAIDPKLADRVKFGFEGELLVAKVDEQVLAYFSSNGKWFSLGAFSKPQASESPYPATTEGQPVIAGPPKLPPAFNPSGPAPASSGPAKSIPTYTVPTSLPVEAAPQVQSVAPLAQPFNPNAPVAIPPSDPVPPIQAPSIASITSDSQKGRIQAEGMLVVATEDGIAAFSESRGRWDRVVVAPRKDGKPYLNNAIVGKNMAVVVINNEIFAFGNSYGKWVRAEFPEQPKEVRPTMGFGVVAFKTRDAIFGVHENSKKWGRLVIPEGSRKMAKYTVGTNTLHAEVDKKLYILSSTTGEWTSPDEPITYEGPVEATTQGTSDPFVNTTTAPNVFSVKIAQFEADALRSAAKVNELTKQHGVDHETVKAARAELDKLLNETLDARFLREEFRVKELRSRLGRLEQQIGQRKSQRAAIIERRADELLNGGAFQWDDAAVRPKARTPAKAIEDLTNSTIDPAGATAEASSSEISEAQMMADVVVGLGMSITDFSKQVTELKRKISLQTDRVDKLEDMLKKTPTDELAKPILKQSQRILERMSSTMNIYEQQYKVARNDAELKLKKERLNVEEAEDSRMLKAGLIYAEIVRAEGLQLKRLEMQLRLIEQIGDLFHAEATATPPKSETPATPPPPLDPFKGQTSGT